MGSTIGAAWQRWKENRSLSVPPEKRLSPDAGATIFIHFCFQFGVSMSSLFLTLYLWRLTESLVINGIYSAVNYAMTPIAFAVGGWIIKRRDRMVTYRIGIAMIALFYLAVVLAGERVVSYYLLFAVCNGIANAFYWIGYLVLSYDVSTDQNRIRFLAVSMITYTLGGLIGPAIAGFVIGANDGLQGYTIVFGTACFMFLLATVGSFRIKPKPTHHKTYYLQHMGLLLRKNRDWSRSLWTFCLSGLLQGLMLFLPSILLFQIVGREDMVGYLSMFYASLGIATGMFMSRFGTESRTGRFVLASALGFLIGTAFIVWEMTLVTVVTFMVIYSICAPLQGNTLTSYYYRMIGRLPLKGHLRVESMVVRELFLNLGRVLSILLVIAVVPLAGNEVLPWIVAAAALLQLTVGALLVSDPREQAGSADGGRKPGPPLKM